MDLRAFWARISPKPGFVDRMVGSVLGYMVIAALVGVVVVFYFLGSSSTMDVLLEVLGVAAGVVTVNFLWRSLNQERVLSFFDGEEVRLKSEGARTYIVMASVGDKDVALQPLKATLYLTSLGVVAEKPGSGESVMFIPLDRISDFGAKQGGINVRFIDVKHQYCEALLFVEDRDSWMDGIGRALAARAA